MNSFKIKSGALGLALLAVLALASCQKEAPQKTIEPAPEKTVTTEEEITEFTEDVVGTSTEEITETTTEILDFCSVWDATAGKGTLSLQDSYKTVEVKKTSDLNAYLDAFTNLSEPEVDEFLSDGNGRMVLIEIYGRQANCTYHINSVTADDSNLEIWVEETEEEETVNPSFTFLLLAIPSDYDTGAPISVAFGE